MVDPYTAYPLYINRKKARRPQGGGLSENHARGRRRRELSQPILETHRKFAIKKAAFDRIFKDVVEELARAESVLNPQHVAISKATPGARLVLQYAVEEYATALMSDCLLFAKHAKRKDSISQKDMRLACGVRGRLLEQHREEQEHKFKKFKGKISKFHA